MTTAAEKEVLSHNLALIVQVLRQNNLASLTIDYAGSGDSGDTFDVAVFDVHGNQGDLPGTELTGMHARRSYGPAPAYPVTIVAEQATRARPFADFLEDFHCMVLSMDGKDGYENNEGGGGTLTITIEGTCTLEHYDYIIEREESTTDLSEFMPALLPEVPEPAPNAIELPKLVCADPYCVEV